MIEIKKELKNEIIAFYDHCPFPCVRASKPVFIKRWKLITLPYDDEAPAGWLIKCCRLVKEDYFGSGKFGDYCVMWIWRKAVSGECIFVDVGSYGNLLNTAFCHAWTGNRGWIILSRKANGDFCWTFAQSPQYLFMFCSPRFARIITA